MTGLYLDVQAYFYISCESFYWKQKNFKVVSPVIIWPSEVLLLMIMHESEKKKKKKPQKPAEIPDPWKQQYQLAGF